MTISGMSEELILWPKIKGNLQNLQKILEKLQNVILVYANEENLSYLEDKEIANMNHALFECICSCMAVERILNLLGPRRIEKELEEGKEKEILDD